MSPVPALETHSCSRHLLRPPHHRLHEARFKRHVQPRGTSQSPDGESRCEGTVRELLPLTSVTALMAFSNLSSHISSVRAYFLLWRDTCLRLLLEIIALVFSLQLLTEWNRILPALSL